MGGGGGVWRRGNMEEYIHFATLSLPEWLLHRDGQRRENHFHYWFSVSLIVRDKATRQCPQTTTFLKRKEAEAESSRGPSADQPNALLLMDGKSERGIKWSLSHATDAPSPIFVNSYYCPARLFSRLCHTYLRHLCTDGKWTFTCQFSKFRGVTTDLWQRLTRRGAEGMAGRGRLHCRRGRTVLRSGTGRSVYSVCVQLCVPLAVDASNTAGLAAAKTVPAKRTFAAANTDLQLQNCTWLCSDNSTSAEPALQRRGNSLFSSVRSTLHRGLRLTLTPSQLLPWKTSAAEASTG